MSDLLFADVLRLDAQVGFVRMAEVAEQAFDGRNRAVRVVADADRQGLCADVGEGQATACLKQSAAAWTLLVARGRRAPVAYDTRWRVLEPAEALAREVATEPRQQRHQQMPLTKHAPALCRRIVAPVSELRADRHQSTNDLPGLAEPSRATAETVADHINWLAGEFPLRAFEHRFEIQRAPVGP